LRATCNYAITFVIESNCNCKLPDVEIVMLPLTSGNTYKRENTRESMKERKGEIERERENERERERKSARACEREREKR